MKRLVSILLLSGFLFQTVSKVVILSNYFLNKEYITQNFCENKSKPMMHCEGKCHLKKQLDKEDRNENGPLNNPNEKAEVLFFQFGGKTVLGLYPAGKFSFAVFQDSKTTFSPSSVFHPPSA